MIDEIYSKYIGSNTESGRITCTSGHKVISYEKKERKL